MIEKLEKFDYDKHTRDNLKKSKSEIRTQIIKNEIARLKDKEGNLPNDALKQLENHYIRSKSTNPIFKVHRTTRRAEIKETLIEMGFEL